MARANARWKETPCTSEPPPLDPSVNTAFEAFMTRKKASMPDIGH